MKLSVKAAKSKRPNEKKIKAKMNCIHEAMHKTTQTATADIDAHKDPSPSGEK
jgi:hypothetical protein